MLRLQIGISVRFSRLVNSKALKVLPPAHAMDKEKLSTVQQSNKFCPTRRRIRVCISTVLTIHSVSCRCWNARSIRFLLCNFTKYTENWWQYVSILFNNERLCAVILCLLPNQSDICVSRLPRSVTLVYRWMVGHPSYTIWHHSSGNWPCGTLTRHARCVFVTEILMELGRARLEALQARQGNTGDDNMADEDDMDEN